MMVEMCMRLILWSNVKACNILILIIKPSVSKYFPLTIYFLPNIDGGLADERLNPFSN